MTYDTFTASNSEKGFFSYFDELIRDRSLERVCLIKGGPGSGKSTFLKKLADGCSEDGLTVEKIHCSSDPQSLDGIRVAEKKAVIIDATPPHTYDMTLPGARDMIIDFGRFWNIRALTESKAEIKALFSEISERYRKCYALLQAAGCAESWVSRHFRAHICHKKISEQLKKIIKQNAVAPVNAGSAMPTCTNRMLSAFSGDGIITYGKTDEALCDGYIELQDSAKTADAFLARAATCFTRLGYDTLLIHSPLSPEKTLEQVILPQLRLGFIATGHPYSPELNRDKIIKTLNTKSFTDREFYTENKNKLAFTKRLVKELTSRVNAELGQIKKVHDVLEGYYIAATDFSALNEFTEAFISRF